MPSVWGAFSILSPLTINQMKKTPIKKAAAKKAATRHRPTIRSIPLKDIDDPPNLSDKEIDAARNAVVNMNNERGDSPFQDGNVDPEAFYKASFAKEDTKVPLPGNLDNVLTHMVEPGKPALESHDMSAIQKSELSYFQSIGLGKNNTEPTMGDKLADHENSVRKVLEHYADKEGNIDVVGALEEMGEKPMTEDELMNTLMNMQPPKVPLTVNSDQVSNDNKTLIVLDPTVVKFDITQATIDEYKKKVPTLLGKPFTDRKAYAEVYETRVQLKNARCAGVNKVDELLEDVKKYSKAVKEAWKVYENQISPLEDQLQAEEDRIKLEIQKDKDRKVMEEAKRIQERTALLIQNGCTFEDGTYSYLQVKFTSDQIAKYTDQEFNTKFEVVKEWHERDVKRKKDEEEKLRESRLQQEKDKEELDARLKDFMVEQVKFRKYQLESIGMKETEPGYYVFANTAGSIGRGEEHYGTPHAKEWQETLSNTIAVISKLTEQEKTRIEALKAKIEADAQKQADAYLVESRNAMREVTLKANGYDKVHDNDRSYYKFEEVYKLGNEHLEKAGTFYVSHEEFNCPEDQWPGVVEQVQKHFNLYIEKQRMVSSRVDDLLDLGMSIEDNRFGFRGKHVHQVFLDNTLEALLRKDNKQWQESLGKARAVIAGLRLKDQDEISRLLDEETKRKESEKGDLEKIRDFRAILVETKSRIPVIIKPLANHLMAEISAGFNRMLDRVDVEIERYM